MKPVALVQLVVFVAACALSPTLVSAQTRALKSEPLKPIGGKVEFKAGFGSATLCGFAEFGEPNSPGKRFRKSATVGQMTIDEFTQAGCPEFDPKSVGYSFDSIHAQPGYPCDFDAAGSVQPAGMNGDNVVYAVKASANQPGYGACENDGPLPSRWVINVNGFAIGAISNGGSFVAPVGATISISFQVGATGSWQPIVPSEGANFQGGLPPVITEDSWDIVEDHGPGLAENPPVCATTATNNSKRTVDGSPTSGPFNAAPSVAYGSAITVATTQTKRTTTGTGECLDLGNGKWMKVTGEVVEELTDEDSEQDTLARAKAAADAALALASYSGASVSAYETTLGGGQLTLEVSRVDYRARFAVTCPGDYEVCVTTAEKPHGASGPIMLRTVTERRRFESGVQVVTGTIKAAQMGTDYSVQKIELRAAGSGRAPGASDIHLNSIHVALSLGQGAAATSAGELTLAADTVSSSLYSPAALVLAAPSDGTVEVIHDGAGVLRQVKGPQTLADIVILDPASYEVRFFSPAEIGPQDGATMLYATVGAPFVIYKFANPDIDQATRLRITETRGSIVRASDYGFDSAASTWSLRQGDGLREESQITTVVAEDKVRTTTVRDAIGAAVSKVTRTYHTFAWGEEVVREVLDPDGAALTTLFEFYDDAATDGGAYSQLRQRTDANGAWERFSYDATGRPTKVVRPFLNAAVTDPEGLGRVTETAYSALPDADGDGLPEDLTTIVERTLGQETARRHRVAWSRAVTLGGDVLARRSEALSVAPGASWNAAGNLVTETLFNTTNPLIGRARRTLNPDGTALLATYTLDAGGQQTAVIKTGQPNGTLDDILDGTRTVSITNPQGQVISETVADLASGLTLSAWTATAFDSLGRPARMDHSDGTYETREYACCGLASQRDRSGAVTSYAYDSLGRPTHVTRFGLTTRTDYDADGRVRSVTRIGTDGSEMVQETSTYDLAGRRTGSRDALNRLTAYGEVFNPATGETTRTTTNPDGGTIVEVNARDGSRLSTGGTAVAPRVFESGVESGQLFTREILAGDGGATTEWVKTFTDFAGRTARTVFADGATSTNHYNVLGQLARTVDPDSVATLFAYNARGEQEIIALDLNGSGSIDLGGTDRITKTINAVATREGFTVRRTTAQTWETEGQDTPTTVSISEQSADGLRAWQDLRGLTTSTVTTYDGSGGRTILTTAPDGTVTTQVFSNDRLQSTVTSHPSLGTLASASYGDDPHGRQISATDARTGATTYTYFDDDQLHTVTTPDPDTTRSGPGYDPQVTTFGYDSAGRVSTVTQPDGGVVTTEYYPAGLAKIVSGARTYPEERTYDSQGRVKTLTTWQNFATSAGAAVTTWNYHPQRGWLDNKRYTDNSGPSYTYKPSGRLLTRTWARGIVTTYGYNAAGDLETVDYSDSTPDVTLASDRTGRPKTITDGAGTRTLTYDPVFGQLKDEDYTVGLLANLSVHRTFDAQARLDSLSANSASSALNQIGYSYDSASRLDAVTSGANTAAYTYVPNSPLVGTVTFKQSGATRLTTTKVYDNLNRLASISSAPSVPSALNHVYSYNSANQRTRATREDNACWDYDYDSLGQVTSAKKSLPGGVPMLGHDFGYAFDDIGNRKTATSNTSTSTYNVNLLNQYDSRTVPGIIDVLGAAQMDATVTVMSPAVNGSIYPTSRQGELFYAQLTADNSTAAQYPTIKITGVKNNVGSAGEDAVTEVTRNAFVPAAQETYGHDADGNLTADARWTYAWDTENRLIAMETSVMAAGAGVPRQKLAFVYDGQSRRVAKQAYAWDTGNSAWMMTASQRFVYDGWNLLAEVDDAGTAERTYVWGLDLSGSLQGAGGVGGLLFANSHLPIPNSAAYAAAFDGNGNVIAYVDMATGVTTATYDYSAFGETLVADGLAPEQFPFRFSTRYQDDETGLSYYGFRYYNPSTGRWLSRDPINDLGSRLARTILLEGDLGEETNLYRYDGNESVGRLDPLGLAFFANRPLDSKLGKFLGVTGSTLDDRLNTVVAHEQLFFDDGKMPTNLGFFDDNQIRSDRSSFQYSPAHDSGWNDCVMRKAVANVKPAAYCLFGKVGKTEKFNCQDWADAVRAEYRRLIRDSQVVSSCCPTDAEKKK